MDGGFQFIDIILFAMIAAFIVLRLRSVLGRRDGTDGSHVDPFRKPPQREKDREDDNVVQLPDRSAEDGQAAPFDNDEAPAEPQTPLAAGLTQIKVADPSFDDRAFIGGAQGAFAMILDAFAKGDRKVLGPLLSNEVMANFETAIDEREDRGETLEATLVGFRSVDFLEAGMNGRNAMVTLKFVSEQVNILRDEEGRVIDGDPNAVETVTDIWTFSRDTRSRDPNWSLVATSTLD
ncbi:MAG: Tim44/TimA family putative adaptor protein [Rhodospirillales bacterium]|nr:Tim44/TimA family putative adaptor protein [Rhodospirillales bacterium]MCW9002732.1 Tim44/TimA family putative adaptor protein [Rhodospirillales bacterium]